MSSLRGSSLAAWHRGNIYCCLQVAQAISTRVDILSPEYLIEIERLQDDVPPFPTVQVCAIVSSASCPSAIMC